MQRLLHILILLISLVGSGNVFAQETETQLKEKADKLFEKQDYVAATPAYLQLLALQPRNPQYNYKYGTCLLFNAKKKQDAIKYLEFATASQSIDLDAFFYMGKAYHLNYQFDEAIKFYGLYKTNSRGKPNKELDVERQIEMCENGQKLLKKLTDIVVLEKKEYQYSEFYKLYDLRGFGGDILVSTSDQSKLDKKKGYTPIIHFPSNAQRIFFASYGDNEANGKQIYVKQKLKEGGWSVPVLVKGEVNTKYDEEFPYMHPNGEYLYFSSKGHNSMGGYDVFKSKYDEASNSFGLPENVDFAISSADNDLFYIVDSLDQNAWFASSRQSQDGKINVYKVRVERLPSSIAAIRGTFSSTVHPENKKFNIEVKDLVSGRQIGTFYSEKDGSYLIALPKGGKYEYSIKITGSPEVFKAVVNVPVLNQFKPLKQEILHEETASKETVKVIDLFDQTVENEASILAEVIKMRSELNPNASQFDLQSLENPAGSKEVFASLGFQKLTPVEVRDKILELTKSQIAQVKNLEDLQQKALAKIVSNGTEIKTLQAEFKNKVNETNKTPDPAEKYKLYVEAEKKAAEITALEQANQQLLRYADSLNKVIPVEAKEAAAAKKLEQLIAQSKADDAQLVKTISENKTQIQSLQTQNAQLPVEMLTKETVKLKVEMDQLTTSVNAFRTTANGLKDEIGALENKLSAAKSKDKPDIQSSIDAKKNELDLMEQEVKSLDKKVVVKAAELDKKESELAYLQNLQNEKLPAKSIAMETAKKAVETSDPNYKTLKSYVSQQKAELEKKNPALANAPKLSKDPEITGNDPENPEELVPNEITALTILKETKPDLDKRLDEIANNPNLSVLEQLKMAQNEELEFEQIVDNGIASLEQQLEKTPSDKTAQTQLKNLQTLKKEVAERIDNRSLAISSLDPENAVVVEKPTKSEVLTAVKPGHEAKLNAINSNQDLSAKEKLRALQQEDQSLQAALNTQIVAMETKLKKDPNDTKTQAEYELLQEIQSETADRISDRQQLIDQKEVVVPENNPEKQPVVIAVKPGHEQKIAAIANDDLLSQQEKQAKLIQEEAKLQKALEAEIKKTDKSLEKDPQNTQWLAEKQQLLAVKEESQTRIDESSQFLIADEKTQIKPTELLYKTDKSYQLDVQKIENSDVSDESEKLIAREKSSQQMLKAQIEKNNLQLAKKDNPKLAAENQVLNELVDASEKRVEILGTPAEIVANTPEPVRISDVRSAHLGSNGTALTETRTEPQDLKNQQEVLVQYQAELQALLKENKTALSKNPQDTKLQTEQKIYQEEIKSVESKIQEVKKQLEKAGKTITPPENVPENTVPENKVPENHVAEVKNNTPFSDHPDLLALQKEASALKTKLTDPEISPKEKESISKEIVANQTKQVKVENALVEENIKGNAANTVAVVKAMEENVAADPKSNAKQVAVLQSVKSSEASLQVQLKESKSEKNPEAKQALLNQVSAQQKANEAKLKQLQEEQAFHKVVAPFQENNPEITLYNLESTKDLETKKRKASIEFGDLTSEIERLNEEIKSSGKAKAKTLVAERDAKMKELEAVQSELTAISKELEKRNEKPVVVYQEVAINENITYQEEHEIAVSPEYKKYYKIVNEANVLKNSITEKEVKLESLKAKNHLLVARDPEFLAPETKVKLEQNLLEIVSLTKELEAEKNQYAEKKQEAENTIKDSGNAMKIQNLIARGVDPISKLVVVSTLVAMPAKGFEIVANPVTAPVKTNIPVGVSVPSGLVYRVQVGAFAKPIKEELFREFNPVSGEKLESGITRYMAGYFNNRSAVLDAKDEIVKLGYSDAFPVAYCDGKRVSMQEARRLEDNKLCIPQGVDNLVVEASQSLSAILPADTSKAVVTTANNPGAYNQAPGAAKAIAVETRLGLFYTVQVGVYNKPVPASQIKNMEPLITKRLPNGQIRYSAGIFQTVESAQTKRREAIAKGINDAYITAYYKGERISLEEAKKLLLELGAGILEKENVKENKIVPAEEIRKIEKQTLQARTLEENTARENGVKEDQVQFVSKNTYAEFPTDILKRFNENGTFYYDPQDGKIKSIVYKNEKSVPQLYHFSEEIDTVFSAKSDSLYKEQTFEIAAKYPGTELSGEIGDWLLKLGYQREIKRREDKIQVRIFDIRDERTFDEMLRKMKSLGFTILMAGGEEQH